METNTFTIVVTRIDDVDVEAFFVTYDNAIMRGKDEDNKAAFLFVYLGGEARSAYCSKFIRGWSFAEESRN